MVLLSKMILGITVTTSPREEILAYIQTYLELSNYPIIPALPAGRQLSNKKKKPLVIVTPNPEQIVLAKKDQHFAAILNGADVSLPDGIGLVVAMRLFSQLPTTNYQLLATKRIPGIEFMEDLVAMAAKNGLQVAFIGGRDGVAEEALARLTKTYPGFTGWAEGLPEISIGDLGNLRFLGDLCEKIKKTNTRLVFVGLGAPKQEYFIEAVSRQHSVIRRSEDGRLTTDDSLVLMSVGGSFDTIAGRVRRAPIFVRSIGLEWVWRLVREPWRWRRQLALVKFLWLVICRKLA